MSDELPRNVDPLPAAIPREERERVVEQLSDCFAHDVLPVAEFEYRVAAAYRVPTRAELVRLIADLPTMGGVDSAVATMPRYVSVVLGNSEQAISGTVPPLLDIRVVMGNAELDLSQARFAAGVTEIRISAFMGNVEITLPPGVAVENQGSSFLGNFEYWGHTRSRRRFRRPRPHRQSHRTRRAELGGDRELTRYTQRSGSPDAGRASAGGPISHRRGDSAPRQW